MELKSNNLQQVSTPLDRIYPYILLLTESVVSFDIFGCLLKNRLITELSGTKSHVKWVKQILNVYWCTCTNKNKIISFFFPQLFCLKDDGKRFSLRPSLQQPAGGGNPVIWGHPCPSYNSRKNTGPPLEKKRKGKRKNRKEFHIFLNVCLPFKTKQLLSLSPPPF